MPTLLSLLGSTLGGFLFSILAAVCFLLASLIIGAAAVLYIPVVLVGKVHEVFK